LLLAEKLERLGEIDLCLQRSVCDRTRFRDVCDREREQRREIEGEGEKAQPWLCTDALKGRDSEQ
jgi:hypothetical protein